MIPIGARVRVLVADPIGSHSLAGMQPKLSCREILGNLSHIRGDHPTAPTEIRCWVRDDAGVEHGPFLPSAIVEVAPAEEIATLRAQLAAVDEALLGHVTAKGALAKRVAMVVSATVAAESRALAAEQRIAALDRAEEIAEPYRAELNDLLSARGYLGWHNLDGAATEIVNLTVDRDRLLRLVEGVAEATTAWGKRPIVPFMLTSYADACSAEIAHRKEGK